jgi:hypothetical protein
MTDLKALAERVSAGIDAYEIPARHPQQLGSVLPPEWFEEHLGNMRKGLVQPYWADVEGYDRISGEPRPHKLVIVVDDGNGVYLAFDPQPDEDDFAMVGTENGLLKLYNIRGDAVDCYLSF